MFNMVAHVTPTSQYVFGHLVSEQQIFWEMEPRSSENWSDASTASPSAASLSSQRQEIDASGRAAPQTRRSIEEKTSERETAEGETHRAEKVERDDHEREREREKARKERSVPTVSLAWRLFNASRRLLWSKSTDLVSACFQP